uniref:BRCA1/BRCA2-containing complex, subunit 3 n=1 Tax=Cyprinus carpio carpio TaxID=630221 RepID=A0A8C1CX72_CYPCA
MWKCCTVINKRTNQRKRILLDCTSHNGSERGTFRVRRISSLYESRSEHGERGSNGALHRRAHFLNMRHRLAEMTGRPMRVVGWYHSHPHITVWPSHVDVRTQAMYQMMDQGFVGLIFSCFIEDKNTKTGRVLYTCFQSVQAQKGSEYERIEIPIHVVPHEAIGKVCLESAVELPRILCQEEQDTYRRIHSLTHLDPITKIHNGSVFTKNLCSQMSAISGPLLQWLEDRLEQNKQSIIKLQKEKEQLTQELASL